MTYFCHGNVAERWLEDELSATKLASNLKSQEQCGAVERNQLSVARVSKESRTSTYKWMHETVWMRLYCLQLIFIKNNPNWTKGGVWHLKNKGKNHIDRKTRKQTLIKLKIFNLRQSKFSYRVQAMVVLFATNDPQKLFLFFFLTSEHAIILKKAQNNREKNSCWRKFCSRKWH